MFISRKQLKKINNKLSENESILYEKLKMLRKEIDLAISRNNDLLEQRFIEIYNFLSISRIHVYAGNYCLVTDKSIREYTKKPEGE